MDDLRGRFRRLDRLATPDLWNEAVGRAAELELRRRPMFNPAMGLIAAALLLAALAGTLAVGAWLNRPVPPPEAVTYDNGLIVGADQCGGVVGIDPASFETRDVVAGADCSIGWGESAWSSDGSRLAYLGPSGPDGTGISVYDAASGESRLLDACELAFCSQIDLSPDGSLVTYLTYRADGVYELVVTEVGSGERHLVDVTSRQPRHPRFSPDGRRIAVPLLGGRSGIYVIGVGNIEEEGIGEPALLRGIIDANGVAWSPDGKWIAYTQSGGVGVDDGQVPFTGQSGGSGDGIVVARTDGSESRVLATGPAGIGPQLATWSPDSTSVAYVTTPPPEGQRQPWALELWTVAIDGGTPTRIYESGCCVDFGAPDWSPDGAWIAFSLYAWEGPSQTGTYLVRPDGSELQRASDVYLQPAWQPLPRD